MQVGLKPNFPSRPPMHMAQSASQGLRMSAPAKIQPLKHVNERLATSTLPQLPSLSNQRPLGLGLGQSEIKFSQKSDYQPELAGSYHLIPQKYGQLQKSQMEPISQTGAMHSIQDTFATSKDFYPSLSSHRLIPQDMHTSNASSKLAMNTNDKESIAKRRGTKALAYLNKNGLHKRAVEPKQSDMQQSSLVQWPHSAGDSKSTHQEAPPRRNYETFELALGGKTGASIFFDGTHAEKMENEEFDRLFGALEGKKFRIGQSVEVNGSRTMDDQLNYLHPKLKQMLKQQYAQKIESVQKSHDSRTLSNSQLSLVRDESSVVMQREEQESPKLSVSIPNKNSSDSTLLQSLKTQHEDISPSLSQILRSPFNASVIAEQCEEGTAESEHNCNNNSPKVQSSQHEQSDQLQMQLPSDTNSLKFRPVLGVEAQESGQLSQNIYSAEYGSCMQLDTSETNIRSESPQRQAKNQEILLQEQQAKEEEMQRAFDMFKKLGGSFFRQPSRQVITTDVDGGLHYEQKSDSSIFGSQFASSGQINRKRSLLAPLESIEESKNQHWQMYKDDVLKVVKKGILTNEPKPKKIVRVPTPEPEIRRLLHLEMNSVGELIDQFDEAERDAFHKELSDFQNNSEPTKFLLDRIDELHRYPNDRYKVQLYQVYKMLFKKLSDLAHSKERLQDFKPESMGKHVDNFISKVYYEFVSDVRAQLQSRKIDEMKTMGMTEEEAQTAAQKYLSGTKLKETKAAYEKRRKVERESRLVEYIKYIIGETANNDFELRREEFKQTQELYTKSLALPFDQYAAKEDNSRKKVANDILERMEINVVIQEHLMPLAAIKYAHDPKFSYFMKMRQQKCLALPILAKVVNKQLSLHNYSLGYEHCTALAEACRFNYHFMSKVMLNNNGLTDESLSILLKGFHQMCTISVLDLRNNKVGVQSVQLMSNFMDRNQPNHLQVLRIIDCKMDHAATALLIDQLSQGSKLRTLALVNATFNSKNEQRLVQYLEGGNTLRELDLSWNQMSQRGFIEVLKVIVAFGNLTMLNLSHNKLIIDPKSFATEEGQIIKQEKMARFRRMADLDKIQRRSVRRMTIKVQQRKRLSSATQPQSQQDSKAQNLAVGITKDLRKSPRQEKRPETLGGLLQIPQRPSTPSQGSYRSCSQHVFDEDIKEREMQKVLLAETYVTKSSQLNQLVTILITQMIAENKLLQHLDLSSTNLPSQVIIFICDTIRASPSLCAVHFTDNPGLEEPGIEKTIRNLLSCKPQAEPEIKVDVNKQIDFALNTNMLERLQNQLKAERSDAGDDALIAAKTLRLRQIMQQKRIEQKVTESPQGFYYRKMILSRIVGMKEQMPGSNQWQFLTQDEDQCWHCEQWIYSLVFWDADTIARHARKQVHHKILNQMVKRVHKINPELEESDSSISLDVYTKQDDKESFQSSQSSSKRNHGAIQVDRLSSQSEKSSPKKFKPRRLSANQLVKELAGLEGAQEEEPLKQAPQIFGDFTNWKGERMMRLDDFIMLLAKRYGRQNQGMHDDFDTIFGEMKERLNLLGRDYTTSHEQDLLRVLSPTNNARAYKDLTRAQKIYYDELIGERKNAILNDWKAVIEQYLEYRKPFLVDAYQLNMKKHRRRCPNLFVLPVFMRAGKHTYLVRDTDTAEYSMHNLLADFRTENPPLLTQHIKDSKRVFLKENSIFEPWIEDTDHSLQLACESDLGASRLNIVVKDVIELSKLQKFIFLKFKDIKLIFLQYASLSNFPNIAKQEIIQFCHDFDLFDPKFKQVDVIQIYEETCQQRSKVLTKDGLNRSEFIEILVRIAMKKYQPTQEIEMEITSATEAFEEFFSLDIFVEWQPILAWQEFRSRYLWSLAVNDVFNANLLGLQKLYNSNQSAGKVWLEYQDVINLFTDDAQLLPESQVKLCFGFSKMTITDETANHLAYKRLQFVEFLELIGRVSVTYWERNKEHLEEVPLTKKIEFILDQLFYMIDFKRKEVQERIY